MKTKRILLAVLLAVVVCVGGVGLLTSFSRNNIQLNATVSAQNAAPQTIAAKAIVARTNPAKAQNISTYDLHEKADFRYSTLADGSLQVVGYSQEGYDKAVAAIQQRGMFSMAMPKDKNVKSVQAETFFYTTSLRDYVEKLYIPANITSIGNAAFHYFQNMTELYFEDGTEELSLEDQTFYGCCALKELYLPARVRIFGDYSYTNPFALATELEHIYVHPSNAQLSSRNSDGQECDVVTRYVRSGWGVQNCLLVGCKNSKIPNSVRIIGPQAFHFSGIEHLVIPDSVTRLDFCALAGAKLKTLVLPKNLDDLGQGTFMHCADLKSVVLPECDFDMILAGNNLDLAFRETYALQCLVAANQEKAVALTEAFREYGHLVTYEIEIFYHFLDGHVEVDKKLFERDLSWTLQDDGSWDLGTYQLKSGLWADASGKAISYDDLNELVLSGEITSSMNLYQTSTYDPSRPDQGKDPVDPDDPNKPDKPVDPDNPDNPGGDGKVEGQGSKNGNGAVKHLWWIIPLVIIAIALLVWAAFAIVAAITGVAGLAGFAVLFAMIFKRKSDEDDWLKRVLKIIRTKV